jgi:hypothetical protein
MLAVEKQGFEIIPEFLDRESIASVSKSLDEMPLRRGRAGARNALWIKSVRDLAFDSKLINIASSLLGGNAVPFRATFLTSLSQQTGWWCGIRTQRCPCVSAEIQRGGGRGRSKKE